MAATSEYFVLTLPLCPEQWQIDKLNKRFEVNRKIYNAILSGGYKRYLQMAQTRRYRSLLNEFDSAGSDKERKSIYHELDKMTAEYRLRRYDFSKDATPYRKYFEKNTDAPVVQNLAVNAWKAVQASIKQRRKQMHVKQPEMLMSLEGKTNHTSIRYQDGVIIWKELRIPVKLKKNAYEREALAQEIRYCRIKWKWIRGKKRYYADLIIKGKCPLKYPLPKCQSEGRVGIDLGLKRIVCVSDSDIYSTDVPSRHLSLEKEKKQLAQKIERSRRAINPQNYDEFGRILPGSYFWKYSSNYRMYKLKYREISRRQAVLREEEQNRILRKIMGMGIDFYVEKLDYAKMKRRFYGRKIERIALAAFLKKADWKFRQYGKRLILVNPAEAKAGSLDHVNGLTENDIQKNLFRSIGGNLIDRQVYSAFLLKNIDDTTGKVQLDKCKSNFQSFLNLYINFSAKENAS